MNSIRTTVFGLAAALALGLQTVQASDRKEIRIDWATYNPMSVLLKKKEGGREKEVPEGRHQRHRGTARVMYTPNVGSESWNSPGVWLSSTGIEMHRS